MTAGASPRERLMRAPFLLGLFLPIQSGGWSPSTLPRTTDWGFEYNQKLTQRAEALGFDLVFGLAQWTAKGGIGGETRFREQSLDPFMTVAALAAVTTRIMLISTVHVLYGPWHPLYLAKMGATLDHISGGRWGLNVVTGFVPSEARMFGNEQVQHDVRYEMADEFTTMLEALWASADNLTIKGRYWNLNDAFVTPKPLHQRPLLVNATGSPAGIDYASRHSDLVFITSPAGGHIDGALAALPAHNAEIKARARERGRTVRTIINPMIVCRATEAEARDYYAAIVAKADIGAIAGFLDRRASGDARGWSTDAGAYRAVGGNIQIIGNPTQVAERLIDLKKAGCDGVQLTFFDFAPDLEFFGHHVLPLLSDVRSARRDPRS